MGPAEDHGAAVHILTLLEKGVNVTTRCGIKGETRRPVWLKGKPGGSHLWEGVAWTCWPSVATCEDCLGVSTEIPRGYIPADELTA